MEEEKPDPKKGERIQRPAKPGRRRPSDWGVGREHSTPSPTPDNSPTSKTP
jgi:hypothetical protein